MIGKSQNIKNIEQNSNSRSNASMERAKFTAPPTTFTTVVEMAHQKNSMMLRNPNRPLHTSLLQKSFWSQLQTTFVHSQNKAALVASSIDEVSLMDSC
eukprot:m.14074 g.14074  ORF g.14074 m.14074 type:complete len:98 (+) comp7688_c0_seq1:131-424(+)